MTQSPSNSTEKRDMPYINRDALVKWAGPHQYQEGKRLFDTAAVKDLLCEDNLVRGNIAYGNRDMLTRFKILKDGSIENLCPCRDSRERGLVCAHAIALGFAYAQEFSDTRTDRAIRIEARRQKHARFAVEYGCIRRTSVKAPHVQPANIRIKLEDGWRASAPAGAIPLSIWVQYRGKKTRLEKTPPEIPFLFSPEEEDLLYCAEDIIGIPVKGPAVLPVDDFIDLLDQTPPGVLFDGETNKPVSLVGDPVTPMLSTEMDEKTGELLLRFHLDLVAKKDEVAMVLLPGRQSAWIFREGNVRPLTSALPREYHDLYDKVMRIERAELPRFLQHDLPKLEEHWLIEHGFPVDRIEWITGSPEFRLLLSGDYERMKILLYADYQGCPGPLAASPDEKIPYAAPARGQPLVFVRRDLQKEAEGHKVLRNLLANFEQAGGEIVVDGAQAIMDVLAKSIPSIKGLGWEVTFEGWLESLKQGVSWIVPEVKCEATGDVGWFDCAVSFRDTEGQTLDPALIQQALLKGEGCVRDGERVWLMDRNNLQALQDILDECESHAGSGRRQRIDAIHAGYVRNAMSALSTVRWSANDAFGQIAGRQNREVSMEPVALNDNLEKIMRGYQKEGVSWLRFLEQCGFSGILADEMGLGKTIQALAWLTLARDSTRAKGKPSLVVCPTSLLENWADESRRFTPDLSLHVIHGSDRLKKLKALEEVDLAITSYALLRRDIQYYQQYEFSAVILDEAQHIKNHSTQNARAAKKLRAVNRLVLTGTPVENSVTDLWSIIDFLMPGYLGSHPHFKRNYEMPIMSGGEHAVATQQRLRQKVHPFLLRRLKRDVAKELPERIDRIAYCTMTPDQRAVYRQLLDNTSQQIVGMVKSQGFVRSRFMILKTLTRLRQVCCHLDLLKMPDLKTKQPSGKLDLFMELLDEAMDGGHRVLVFSQFVSMLHIIRDRMKKEKIPFCYLDGATVQRWEEVQRFNEDSSVPLFLISLKAGGTGLNLTGADMVIHFDPWWNPAVEDQATDRAHRIGQHKTVYNVKLITRDSIEEKVLDLQKRKRAVIDATLTAEADIIRSLSWEDVQDLLQL